MESLFVSMHSWIIQDGNYDDFSVGNVYPFALEFSGNDGLCGTGRVSHPSAVQVKDDRYRVSGNVVHVSKAFLVIDVGVLVYWENPAKNSLSVGDGVVGEIGLGVDPFFYFETHARSSGAPALIYDWVLEEIFVETAPLVETGVRTWERDPTKLAWNPIPRTRAWTDDDGHAEYLLKCRPQSLEPRKSR